MFYQFYLSVHLWRQDGGSNQSASQKPENESMNPVEKFKRHRAFDSAPRARCRSTGQVFRSNMAATAVTAESRCATAAEQQGAPPARLCSSGFTFTFNGQSEDLQTGTGPEHLDTSLWAEVRISLYLKKPVNPSDCLWSSSAVSLRCAAVRLILSADISLSLIYWHRHIYCPICTDLNDLYLKTMMQKNMLGDLNWCNDTVCPAECASMGINSWCEM